MRNFSGPAQNRTNFALRRPIFCRTENGPWKSLLQTYKPGSSIDLEMHFCLVQYQSYYIDNIDRRRGHRIRYYFQLLARYRLRFPRCVCISITKTNSENQITSFKVKVTGMTKERLASGSRWDEIQVASCGVD